jgi:hypothetical protein
MKKRFRALVCATLLITAFLLMGCPSDAGNPSGPPTYKVILTKDGDGTGTIGFAPGSPTEGPALTEVSVVIASGGNSTTTAVTLDGVAQTERQSLTIILTDKDRTVNATFTPLQQNGDGSYQDPDNPGDITTKFYKVSLTQVTGGTISFTIGGAAKELGAVDSVVKLSNTPASGYLFTTYTTKIGDAAATDLAVDNFKLANNVTVSAVFTKIADTSANDLLTSAENALKDAVKPENMKDPEKFTGYIKTAVDAFEAAYQKLKDTPDAEGYDKALVYSTLGKLASLAYSTEVGNFFKTYIGLAQYPGTLNVLLDPTKWFGNYPDIVSEYYDNTLGTYVYWYSLEDYLSWAPSNTEASFNTQYPNGEGYYYYDSGQSQFKFVSATRKYTDDRNPPLTTPAWVKAKDPYKDSLIDGTIESSSTWPIILIANLIDRNTTGLNPALDSLIDSVFNGATVTEVRTRVKLLTDKKISVVVDEAIIKGLGADEFLGTGDVSIGWAELTLVTSALQLVEATLEYVNSYNWGYSIAFVKNLAWNPDALTKLTADQINGVLPFKTNFMTDRGGAWLTDSQADYAAALTAITGVYKYYTGESSPIPQGGKDKLDEFKWALNQIEGLTAAVKDKIAFTVKNDKSADVAVIDFAKFFTPGQFAITGLIENDAAKKAPKFYGWNNDPSDGGVIEASIKVIVATTLENVGKEIEDNHYDEVGFKFKLDKLEEVVTGGELKTNLQKVFKVMGIPAPVDQILFAAYYQPEAFKDFDLSE